jgi:sugar porter (SP) family MFS transporter
MMPQAGTGYVARISLIVALGGFLMGFDASVISGVLPFIKPQFNLTQLELGWAVASLTLTATLAMMLSGPLADRFGRRPVLQGAALLFAVSALVSAAAPNFAALVIARLLGGLGVGAALVVAPMYIAEIAPARLRGRMVSFNQLNIVLGISAAFFSNYLILQFGQAGVGWAQSLHLGDWNWRWMLGIEALPSACYFAALYSVPESPRWLLMRGQAGRAREVLARVSGSAQADIEVQGIEASLAGEGSQQRGSLRELWRPAMRLVLAIGITVAILQQITGINSVFFYAPMIFEQSGIGRDAAFMQAVLVGLVNLAFTVLAIGLIDRLGRRPLLIAGVAGVAACLLLLAYGFGSASYQLGAAAVASLPGQIDHAALAPLVGHSYGSDLEFRHAIEAALGSGAWQDHQSALVRAAIQMNPMLVLAGVLGFVASFAVSLGPVMWVLFSELFPNRIRGVAISFVGLINSGVSFLVQLLFPWELEKLGNSGTFLLYGVLAVAGLLVVARLVPETKGRSLEEIEADLVGH